MGGSILSEELMGAGRKEAGEGTEAEGEKETVVDLK